MSFLDRLRGHKSEKQSEGPESIERGDMPEYVAEEIDSVLKLKVPEGWELTINGYEKVTASDGGEIYKVRAHKINKSDNHYALLDFEVRVKDGQIIRSKDDF